MGIVMNRGEFSRCATWLEIGDDDDDDNKM